MVINMRKNKPYTELNGRRVLLVGGAGYIGGLTCDVLQSN